MAEDNSFLGMGWAFPPSFHHTSRGAVMAAAGFRGAVSLAAALAVPDTPNRDLIVFVTSGVIAVTLLIQAPLLPRVVRWARLPEDRAAEQERHRADIAATENALQALHVMAAQRGTDQGIAEQLRTEYDRRLRMLRDGGDAADWEQQYTDLRLDLIDHKHATVVRMRDDGEIDDEVLLELQDHLDIEAVQLKRDRTGP